MAFVPGEPIDLCGPLLELVLAAHDRLHRSDRTTRVRVDEAAPELGTVLLDDTGDGAAGPDDPVLDTPTRDVHRHLAHQFIPVRHDNFCHALLVAVQNDVGGDDRLTATCGKHGEDVSVTGIPLIIDGLLEDRLVWSEDDRHSAATRATAP